MIDLELAKKIGATHYSGAQHHLFYKYNGDTLCFWNHNYWAESNVSASSAIDRLSKINFNEPSIETLQSAPRTKVEYVKCEVSEAVYWFTETLDDLYAEPDESQKYDGLQDFINNMDECGSGSLYRRTEVEIDVKYAVREYIDDCVIIRSCSSIDQFLSNSTDSYDDNWDEEWIKMCHLVAELTDKPE